MLPFCGCVTACQSLWQSPYMLYDFDLLLICNDSYWPQNTNVGYSLSAHALTACIPHLWFFSDCWYCTISMSCCNIIESKLCVVCLGVIGAYFGTVICLTNFFLFIPLLCGEEVSLFLGYYMLQCYSVQFVYYLAISCSYHAIQFFSLFTTWYFLLLCFDCVCVFYVCDSSS